MSLEQSFRRLAIQPKTICRHCRRALSTSVRTQQSQPSTGSTAALTELLQASRSQSQSQQRTPPAPRPSQPMPQQQQQQRSGGHETAMRTITDIQSQRLARQQKQQNNLTELARKETRRDLESQAPRRWRVGDIYAPHDLSGVEASKWKKPRRKPKARSGDRDVLDQLGINPLEEYKNFSVMAEYVSEMGRIKGSSETGLRPVNQRRMAKAIRRSIGMGLMPSTYRHPELLREEIAQRNR